MKSALITFTAVLCICFFASVADAATATPDGYQITVQKIEVSADSGATWYVLGSGDITMDIASVSSGSQVGAYISGAVLPDGTYNRIRTTISNQLTLRGSVVQDAGINNGQTFCTDDDGTPSTGACTAEDQSFSIVTNTGFGSNLTLSGSTIQILETSSAFTIFSDSDEIVFVVDFDVSNALVIEADDTVHPAAPVVSIRNL